MLREVGRMAWKGHFEAWKVVESRCSSTVCCWDMLESQLRAWMNALAVIQHGDEVEEDLGVQEMDGKCQAKSPAGQGITEGHDARGR